MKKPAKQNLLFAWYKKQPITMRAAYFTGLITLVSALMILLLDKAIPNRSNIGVLETPIITPTLASNLAVSTSTPLFDDIASHVLMEDEFIDNRNGWTVLNEQDIEADIIGGKYKFSFACPWGNEGPYCGAYVNVPGLSSKDLQVELDVEMKDLSPDIRVELVFQFIINQGNAYFVRFSSGGMYTIYRSSEQGYLYDNSANYLLGDTAIPDFSPNTDTMNRYGFISKDNSLKPLLNGQELLSTEERFINQAGSIKIGVFVSRGGSVIVELDNFIARDFSEKASEKSYFC